LFQHIVAEIVLANFFKRRVLGQLVSFSSNIVSGNRSLEFGLLSAIHQLVSFLPSSYAFLRVQFSCTLRIFLLVDGLVQRFVEMQRSYDNFF